VPSLVPTSTSASLIPPVPPAVAQPPFVSTAESELAEPMRHRPTTATANAACITSAMVATDAVDTSSASESTSKETEAEVLAPEPTKPSAVAVSDESDDADESVPVPVHSAAGGLIKANRKKNKKKKKTHTSAVAAVDSATIESAQSTAPAVGELQTKLKEYAVNRVHVAMFVTDDLSFFFSNAF
jgi:hypothetical protein